MSRSQFHLCDLGMPPVVHTTEHDQLFYLVHEKVKVQEQNIEPHLWSYRQRISLEHLGQTIQGKNLKEKFPILHEFLQKVVFKIVIGAV